MMRPYTVADALSSRIAARFNLSRDRGLDAVLSEAYTRHTDELSAIVRECLPSGSGIDRGPVLDTSVSTANRLVLRLGFHHMDEHGFYDRWTDHAVIVQPAFVHGLTVTISGRDHNLIKDHLADTF